MHSLMMTCPLGKQGTKHSTNSKPHAKNPSQQSKKDFTNCSNSLSNQLQQTYYKSSKTTATPKQQAKPTNYTKAKNVGSSKVFYRDYDYIESLYVAKPLAKPEYKLSPEKTPKNLSGCSTLASEEELNTSWLYGFRIVHDGKTLHNEAQSDVEEVTKMNSLNSGVKFAGSLYNIGPSCKDIPLPSFLDEDDEC